MIRRGVYFYIANIISNSGDHASGGGDTVLLSRHMDTLSLSSTDDTSAFVAYSRADALAAVAKALLDKPAGAALDLIAFPGQELFIRPWGNNATPMALAICGGHISQAAMTGQ